MKKWSKSKAYGNMAENIVEMLIKSMPDWKCIRFGVENHIEELRSIVRRNINPVTKRVKSMPDFIAYNTKTGETLFIETKFRGFIDKKVAGKSEYKLDFLNEYLEYWKGTKLIIVHDYKPYFFVIDLDDVKQDMSRSEEMDKGKWRYYWDFNSIEKGIKDLFPDLEDEMIEIAIKMIPKKKKNE